MPTDPERPLPDLASLSPESRVLVARAEAALAEARGTIEALQQALRECECVSGAVLTKRRWDVA
jgi:hypothetical protein